MVVPCSPGVVVDRSEGWRLFFPCILPDNSLVPFVLTSLLGDDTICLLPGLLLSVALVFFSLALLQPVLLCLDYSLRLADGELVAGCWGRVCSLGPLERWWATLSVLSPLRVVPWVRYGLPRLAASLVLVPVRQLDCGTGH
jgi:hypothetical protein